MSHSSASVLKEDVLQKEKSKNCEIYFGNSFTTPVFVRGQNLSLISPKHMSGSVVTINDSITKTHLSSSNSPPFQNIISKSPKSSHRTKIYDNNSKVFGMNTGLRSCASSNSSDMQISSKNLPSLEFEDSVQSPANVPDCANKNFIDTSISIKKEISITSSTALQSGAHVITKPVSQSNQVVKAFSIFDCQSTIQSSETPIQIKKEPQDESEADATKDSKCFPVIESVFSCHEVKNISDKDFVSNIKVEESDDEDLEDAPKDLNSSPPIVLAKDEDHKFLLSVLPKMKELPRDLKSLLKSEIKNLVEIVTSVANNRKRKANEMG